MRMIRSYDINSIHFPKVKENFLFSYLLNLEEFHLEIRCKLIPLSNSKFVTKISQLKLIFPIESLILFIW